MTVRLNERGGEPAMRVLFICRDRWQSCRAGDSIQMFHTRRALQTLGIQVDLATTSQVENDPRWSAQRYDWIHLFNLLPVEETWKQACWAQNTPARLALSTVYWDVSEFLDRSFEKDMAGRMWWAETQELRRKLVQAADVLLPNSMAEAGLIANAFGADTTAKCRVVPNGVDPQLGCARPESFRALYGTGPFVLCAARVVRRKNQLALIEALRGTGLPLVLIGPVNDPAYYRECMRAAGANVHFFAEMTQPRLASAYAAARVHALPSWFDTPGLSTLEAGLLGCRVVASDRGATVEYLANLAWYCEPGSPESIRKAVLDAWHNPETPPLKERILTEFTWEKAAEATLAAYKGAGVRYACAGSGND